MADQIFTVEVHIVNGSKKAKRSYVFTDVNAAWDFADQLPPAVYRKATTSEVCVSAADALGQFAFEATELGIVL